MSIWNRFLSRLRATLYRSRLESEMNEELRFHLDAYAEDLVRAGVPHDEALRRARIEFGGLERAKEECRDAHGVSILESFLQDLRFGLRMLRKNAGFTAVTVLTLALGVGANVAVFSMVDGLILRPLPLDHPEQLTFLAFERPDDSFDNNFSYPEFQNLRNSTTDIFSDAAAYGESGFEAGAEGPEGLTVDGITKSINTAYVTGNFFNMLGVRSFLGRVILPAEGREVSADPVIILSYRYWKSRFAGDPSIIGKNAFLNGHAVTIVGVAAKDFLGVFPIIETQAYLPLGMAGAGSDSAHNFMTDPTERNLIVLARKRSNETLSQVQPALSVTGNHLSRQNRDPEDKNLRAYALQPPGIINGQNPLPLLSALFLGLAGLVLLLACVNVANLVLVRGALRTREMALRVALGAERARLIRQVLTEGLLLAFFGGIAGIISGIAGTAALGSIPIQTEVPIVLNFQTDWRVFAYAFAVTLMTGLLVSTVPAIRASRGNPGQMLRESGRTFTASGGRLRSLLISVQVGGSLMLLIVAGLFVRSLSSVRKADLGFHSDHLLNLTVNPHEIGFTSTQGMDFYRAVLDRVRALPGVESASFAATVPLGDTVIGDDLQIPDYPLRKNESAPHSSRNAVTPAYLETMGIALIRGRDFTEADNDNTAPHVALINEQFAKKFWRNQDALGRQFTRSSDPKQAITVIGIVKNIRANGIFNPNDPYDPMFYQPLAQSYSSTATLQIRTRGEPQSLVHAATATVSAIQTNMPISGVRTMTQALNGLNGLFLFNLGAELAGLMGLLGLTLSVVGVFGITSYVVSQRTNEIAVRMALGAQPSQIFLMIISHGMIVIGVGLALGLFAAFVVTRLLSDFLVDVSPSDPLTYLSVSLLLALASLAACCIPTQRAARADPMGALRYE
ncbi:MAG: ABC transporter permease [Candidatus Acidiferrum sp.]